MVNWKSLFGMDDAHGRRGFGDEVQSLLPTRRDENIPSAIPAREVTKVALRLKHQLEVVIPCELPEETITQAHSKIITDKVIETAKSAGGEQYRACVVYCLLVCKKWFKRQALIELWDADLHDVRAVACEVLAKQIIEREEDGTYLMEEVLLKRFATLVDGEETLPSNAVEKAVDLHALRVIGSAGYQRCINYLWRGWLIQDENDPSRFVDYKDKINTSFWAHLEPDRMRAPLYQNAVQIAFSIIFVALYTGAINTINPSGDLDVVEGLLYVFTLGFIADELAKFWKVGYLYLSFWPIFNSLLYALLTVSFAMRTVALSHSSGTDARIHFNELSYNFLAFSAPMFWVRLMLYLDSFRFFGAMLVVLKVMMKESIIFFALLIVVLVGFLQAFMGMDEVDSKLDAFGLITREMANAIMGSPNLDAFDDFAYPFGTILYYIFSFIIMVLLLNILIALYNSAYEDITGNAIDEFMAIFAQKTLQFVRAPDENVYIAPFNLIEILFLVLPFEWWLSDERYEKFNDVVMGIIYSPVLVIVAWYERRKAWEVRANRKRGESDDDTIEEWEQLHDQCDFEGEGWTKKVESTTTDITIDGTTAELKKLRSEVGELKEMMAALVKNAQADGN